MNLWPVALRCIHFLTQLQPGPNATTQDTTHMWVSNSGNPKSLPLVFFMFPNPFWTPHGYITPYFPTKGPSWAKRARWNRSPVDAKKETPNLETKLTRVPTQTKTRKPVDAVHKGLPCSLILGQWPTKTLRLKSLQIFTGIILVQGKDISGP